MVGAFEQRCRVTYAQRVATTQAAAARAASDAVGRLVHSVDAGAPIVITATPITHLHAPGQLLMRPGAPGALQAVTAAHDATAAGAAAAAAAAAVVAASDAAHATSASAAAGGSVASLQESRRQSSGVTSVVATVKGAGLAAASQAAPTIAVLVPAAAPHCDGMAESSSAISAAFQPRPASIGSLSLDRHARVPSGGSQSVQLATPRVSQLPRSGLQDASGAAVSSLQTPVQRQWLPSASLPAVGLQGTPLRGEGRNTSMQSFVGVEGRRQVSLSRARLSSLADDRAQPSEAARPAPPIPRRVSLW